MWSWLYFIAGTLLAMTICAGLAYRLDNRRLWHWTEAEGDTSKPYFRRELGEIVVLSLFTGLSMLRGLGGFFLLMAAFLVPAYAIEGLISIWKREKRHDLKITVAHFLAASVMVAGCHAEQYLYARHEGEKLLAEVQGFQRQHGHFPASDEEMEQIHALPGIDWGVADFTYRHNKPEVVYAGTIIYWTHHYYDFEQRRWCFYMML